MTAGYADDNDDDDNEEESDSDSIKVELNEDVAVVCSSSSITESNTVTTSSDDIDRAILAGRVATTSSVGKTPGVKKKKKKKKNGNGNKKQTKQTTIKKALPQAPNEPPVIIRNRYASILRNPNSNRNTAITTINTDDTEKKEKILDGSARTNRTTVVQFGSIHIREMKRGISFDTVPTDNGTFPLGICDEIIHEYDITVDEYDVQKKKNKQQQQDLHGYKQQMTHKKSSSVGSFNKHFEPLSEAYRKIILLSALDSNYHLDEEIMMMNRKKEKIVVSSLSSSTTNNKSHNRRATAPTRRNKVASATTTTTATTSKNPTYHNMELEHLLCVVIRNDLERITIDRSVTGCNCCRRSKHHHHHHPTASMNDRKLREELRKRKLLHPEENCNDKILPDKKQELVQRLQQAIEKEPCCRVDNCPCVQNGINCHEMACSCCSSTAQHSNNNPTQDKAELCGNIYGLDSVDIGSIQKKRAEFCNKSSSIHAK